MKNSIEKKPDEKFQWHPDWADRIAHTDINLVIAEIKDIEEVMGKVTPGLLVDSSKNKKSVLHGYFEWDNEKAATNWRLRQASVLLNKIQVKVLKDGEPKLLHAYAITKRTFGSNADTTYARFDLVTVANIDFIVKVCISDLLRVKNKLTQYTQYTQSIDLISQVIQLLESEKTEESTETKTEEKPAELKAVG